MTRLNLFVGVIAAALAPLAWVGCTAQTGVVQKIPGMTGQGGSTTPTGAGGSVSNTGTGGTTTTDTGGTIGTGTGGMTTMGTGGMTTMGTPDASTAVDSGPTVDPNRPINVLIWNNALAYGHQSRVTAIPLLVAAGAPFNIKFDTSHAITTNPPPNEGVNDLGKADGAIFTDALLDPFDVVFFLNTTGLTLNVNGQEAAHKLALQNFMDQKGRGFVGTHSATDTYQGNSWGWYVDLVGANFVDHADDFTPGTARYQPGVTHPILSIGNVPNPWNRSEEWYTFNRDVTSLPGITVLLTCTDTGARQFGQRPITWVHNLTGGGRVFYSAYGHRVSAFQEKQVMDMIITGIRWAAHRI